MSQKENITFVLDVAATGTGQEYFGFDERMTCVGATYVNEAEITGNNTNFRSFYIQDGAGTKTYFQYRTNLTNQGTIPAKTVVNFVAGANVDEATHEAGSSFRLYTDHDGGSGKAADGTLIIQFEKARKYS
tara:strand:+ start:445 stop:837 length:393 start_codon:yes stop_codon:yes gene_type:complete